MRAERYPDRVQDLDDHQDEEQAVDGEHQGTAVMTRTERVKKLGRRFGEAFHHREREQYAEDEVGDGLDLDEPLIGPLAQLIWLPRSVWIVAHFGSAAWGHSSNRGDV